MNKWMGWALVALMAASVRAELPIKKDAAPVKSKGFLDDFAAAQKEAAALKQPIFVFFTGSDWCGWCIKLRREALDTKAFEKFAAENLVLFEADFPRGKQLPASVKKQNEALAQKYGVRGFPTVVLMDETGKVLGQTGYQEGGADAYVKHLKELLEKAGVKTADASASSGKGLTPYERLKAEKAAKEKEAAGGAKAE